MTYLINLLLIFLAVITNIGFATDATLTAETAVVTEEKPDKYNRRTPRGTVEGYLEALAEGDFSKASYYLNLDFIPNSNKEKEGIRISKKFQYFLDHAGKLQPNALISDHPDGTANDGLDLNEEDVGIIYIDEIEIPVVLEQVKGEDSSNIWLFSSETLKNIPRTGSSKSNIINIADFAPEILIENKILGVSIGHWLMMVVAALFSFLIAKICINLIVIILKLTINKYISDQTSIMITALHIPARMWLSVYIFIISLQYLSIPIIMRQHFNSVALAVYLVAFLILAWQLTNIAHFLSIERFKKYNNAGVVSIIDFLKRSVRFILVVTGLLLGLHLYDHNVTTGLAALGIGGLAIALGAQKTLENIAGSINVVADQSVNIGDFCAVAGVKGFVEEVGIRSTKIRTLFRTLVTIPNAEFASHIVENCTKRDKFWFNQKIGLRYETSPDQLRFVLIKIQSLLYAHSKVENTPSYTRFSEFGADSLVVEIFAYIKTKDYFEYMGIKQDLNLRIIDIINSSGTGFAFPSQTLYLSKDHGLSTDKTIEAEQCVKSWISASNLQLPEFSEDEINRISNSIPYPSPSQKTSNSSS